LTLFFFLGRVSTRLYRIQVDLSQVDGSFVVLQVFYVMLGLGRVEALAAHFDLDRRPHAQLAQEGVALLAAVKLVFRDYEGRVVDIGDRVELEFEGLLQPFLGPSEQLLKLGVELLLHAL